MLVCALTCGAAQAEAQDNPFSSWPPDDPFTFQGIRQDPIPDRPDAWRITFTGPVELVCNDTRVFADEVVYETDSADVELTGNVTLEQPELRVFAERAHLNRQTRYGTFYNASGTHLRAPRGDLRPPSTMGIRRASGWILKLPAAESLPPIPGWRTTTRSSGGRSRRSMTT